MLLLHEQITILPQVGRRMEKVYQASDNTYLWISVESNGKGTHTILQKQLSTEQYIELLKKICSINKESIRWS